MTFGNTSLGSTRLVTNRAKCISFILTDLGAAYRFTLSKWIVGKCLKLGKHLPGKSLFPHLLGKTLGPCYATYWSMSCSIDKESDIGRRLPGKHLINGPLVYGVVYL